MDSANPWHGLTTWDDAENNPAYAPARSGMRLSDRQLFAVFERVCSETGVGRWTSATGPHFDVIAEDIRAELGRLLHAATFPMDLRHALRIVAWTWEKECMVG